MTIHDGQLSNDQLKSLYECMVRIRLFEETVANLVEAKEIATPCHFCIGQEAPAAGICSALRTDDYIWGGHRSHGHYLAKGGSVNGLMAEIFCRATGCSGGRGGSMHVCAPEVGVLGTVPIVAATIPVAVGSGLASALRRDGRVTVSFFGDGATEEGHFHESLNLAGLYNLPVIFACENNLYSSHMSLHERRRKDNIPESGAAHGVPSERVDGNDVQEVYRAACRAVERARSGAGPTLLELRTFRWRGHVGPAWDMDVGVKRKDELKHWLQMDPIRRCADELAARGIPQTELQTITAHVHREIDEAVEFARQSPLPEPVSLTRHVTRAA